MAMLFIILLLNMVLTNDGFRALTSKDVCQFEQNCSNSAQDLTQYSSCCIPCECDDVCFEKGTCCLDKYNAEDNKTFTKQVCVSASYGHGFRTRNSYFTRSKCPSTFQDTWTIAKCEGSNIPKTFEDILFVSSADGSVVYRNTFCALCHGETDVLAWKVQIDRVCMKELSETFMLSPAVIVDTVLTKCMLSFKRPDITPLSSVLCFNDDRVISECNITGKWGTFDLQLVNLCGDPQDSALYFDQGLNRIFKNAYCFLCNVPWFPVPETCQLDQIERTQSLVTLLDSSRWYMPVSSEPELKSPQIRTSDYYCKNGTIFDPFLRVCKTIHCPILTVLVGTKCIPFVENDFGYLIDLQLFVQDENYKLNTSHFDFTTVYSWAKLLLRMEACDLCSGRIQLPFDSELGVSNLRIKLGVKSTINCTTNYIVHRVSKIERFNMSANINIGQTMTQIAGFLVDPSTFDANKWDITMVTPTIANTCGRTLFPNRRYNCPRIKLSAHEYDMVMKNHSRAKRLLFSKVSQDSRNTEVFVCFENYFEHAPRKVIRTTSLTSSASTAFYTLFSLYFSSLSGFILSI